jgi:hypothetical protein
LIEILFRNYEIADLSTVPEIIKELIQVLTCDHMGLCLSNMTGLGLHSSIVKEMSDSDEDEEYLDSEEEGDSNVEEEESNEASEEDSESALEDSESGESEKSSKDTAESDHDVIRKRARDLSDGSDDVSPKPTISQNCNDSASKRSKPSIKDEDLFKENSNRVSSSSLASDFLSVAPGTSAAANAVENSFQNQSKPKCYLEIRKWKPGCYTLITDDNNELKTKALDLMLYFKCKFWSLECGGNVSYIARDEDNEVIFLFFTYN